MAAIGQEGRETTATVPTDQAMEIVPIAPVKAAVGNSGSLAIGLIIGPTEFPITTTGTIGGTTTATISGTIGTITGTITVIGTTATGGITTTAIGLTTTTSIAGAGPLGRRFPAG